ncbi:MAG: hypothetical protein ACR2LM_17970 [Pyrinomonadaceae bacterium]
MKNVKSMFAAITLGLMLSCSAYAGDVSTPGYAPPPPPPAATLENSETTAPGEISSPGLTIELLIAALSALY